MRLSIWLSFVGVSFVFGLIPGPSVCFTIARALRHGARRTLITIAGQLAANFCQILVVLFGLSGLIERSALVFQGLKIGGAAYLAYLGYRQWTAGKPELNGRKWLAAHSRRRALVDGFIVCGTNPKAILYYAALLPQFVLPSYDEHVQLITLSVTSLVIAALVLVFYAALAHRARTLFDKERHWKTQNRLTAILLMIGAVFAWWMAFR